MKKLILILNVVVLAGGGGFAADTSLELLTNAGPAGVFFGPAQKIPVAFHNSNDQDFDQNIQMRVYQTSSATAIALGEQPWKTLHVLPGQTILELASVDFPPVKAVTKFLVQWLAADPDTTPGWCAVASHQITRNKSLLPLRHSEWGRGSGRGGAFKRVQCEKSGAVPGCALWLAGTNHVIGSTEVLVYPTNLLDELKVLLADREENLGLLDPRDQLLPALTNATVKFVNLEETTLADFGGKLVLVGPCQPNDPEWSGLAGRVSQLARRGIPAVWVQSVTSPSDKLWPSFYAVPKNNAVVVVVQPSLVADLPDNPQSQLNLIYFCKLALHPQSPALPDLSLQP